MSVGVETARIESMPRDSWREEIINLPKEIRADVLANLKTIRQIKRDREKSWKSA